MSHTIELKFQIVLVWYEYRATYFNLKQQVALNALSIVEIDTLWIPYVIYKNTDNNEAVKVNSPPRGPSSVTMLGN